MKKKSKPKITLKAKNPKKIKAALKTWVQAADKNDSDPFDMDDAPAWAENAFVEAVKVTLPGERLPTAGRVGFGHSGRIIGASTIPLGKLYAGEIPMGPETTGDYEKKS